MKQKREKGDRNHCYAEARKRNKTKDKLSWPAFLKIAESSMSPQRPLQFQIQSPSKSMHALKEDKEYLQLDEHETSADPFVAAATGSSEVDDILDSHMPKQGRWANAADAVVEATVLRNRNRTPITVWLLTRLP